MATFLDHGGLSARVVADQLGHARISMTQDVYMGRNVVHSSAALTLEQLALIGDGDRYVTAAARTASEDRPGTGV